MICYCRVGFVNIETYMFEIEGISIFPIGFFLISYWLSLTGNAQDDKQKGNHFCVWITSEPCPMIPSFLLQNLHKIAWNHITEDVVNSGPQKEESKDTEAANQSPKAPLTMVYRSPGTYLHSGKHKYRQGILALLTDSDKIYWNSFFLTVFIFNKN